MRIPQRLVRFVTTSAIALVALAAHSGFTQTFTVTPPSPGCQLLSAPAGTQPAFCDTFDKPEGIGNRSGALNGTVWGVSRYFGGINQGQGQFYDASPAGIDLCGTTFSVIEPNDVQICDGLLVESVFDQTTVTNLAIYPKQPFDISGGRTGTIAFDVSDDSHGTHSVWPELWYTDKPVPTPFVHDTLYSVPANGFGIRLAGTCPANSGGGCGVRGFCPEYSESVPVVTVDSVIIVNNYAVNDVGVFSNPPAGTPKVQDVDCVQASSGPGNMNHFEFRVSQNEIDVYGIDAGATGPLKKIAIITNAGLSLTAGLLWMEDNHYNANKTSNGQGDHTFTWDNFTFDGPVIARDLAFDVLDARTPVGPGYPGLLNMGWNLDPNSSTPLTLTIPNVYNVNKADKAFLTFNFDDFNYRNLSTPTPFISYSVNNGLVQQAPFPFGACPVQNGGPACGEYTIAVPVNLPDVVDGTNTIQFTSTDGAAIANVDLILHGAAGIPCTSSCPATLPTPTITITPTPATVTTAQGVSVAVSVTSSSGPVPTGAVTLSEAGYTSAASTLSSGSATITIPAGSLPAGNDLLTVSYSGDTNYAYASNNSSVTVSSVAPVANNASLEVSPSAYPSITTSDPFTLLIDLFGNGPLAPLTVTGTVTVTGGGYNSGAVPLSGGVATISIPPGGLADGSDTFAVNYSGDSNFAANDYTNTLTISVTGPGGATPPMTTPTVTVTPSEMSITTAQPLTVAVTVGNSSLVATGTVTLSGGGIAPQTVTLSNTGAASFTIAAGAMAVGSDTLTVSYSGDTNYNAASGTATVTVTTSTGPTKTTPAITITPSSTNLTTAQQLTLVVSVAGSGNSAPTATGTVTLTGGGIPTDVLPLSNTGGATFTIAPGILTVGSDTLTVSYSGDINYNATTNTSTVTVTTSTTTTPVTFTITGTAVTITAGATTGNTSTITVASSPACNCNVALTAAIASGPASAQDPPTLSFGSTTPVNLTSSTSGTATLTITTKSNSTQASTGGKMPWLPAGGAALACAFLLGIPANRRRWQRILATVLLLVALSLGLQGCTGPKPGGGGLTGTTPGTYVITVTGVSGTNSGAGTVTLTVQ